MNPSEHGRHVRLQKGFNVSTNRNSSLSYHTKSERDQVHAAMRTAPHKRPRPGRRRLSMHHLSLSLTRILLSVAVMLSLLCVSTEAVENSFSPSRTAKGNFVDGRIMFDHERAPQPILHRRDDPASSEIASTTTAADVSVTAASSDTSTTTTSLPTAFDGGFGTNYTQPSCPTFLRSMVNNDTFISCIPFSLLLQVRPLFPPSSIFLFKSPLDLISHLPEL